MSCLSKIAIKNRYGEIKHVPCGRCVNCRVQKRISWQQRLALESYTQRNYGSSFVTLTYNDANIPLNGSLSKEDFQKFIKRIRYYAKKNKYFSPTFKYFAVGEYGDNTTRCHYHFLAFGCNSNTMNSLCKKAWKKGFVTCTPLTSGRIRYVVDYMTQFGPTREGVIEYEKKGLTPPFRLCSGGLGYEEMKRQRDYIAENNGYIRIGSKKLKLSQYFLDKLGIVNLSTDFSSLLDKCSKYGLEPTAENLDDLALIQAKSIQGTERLHNIPFIKMDNIQCDRGRYIDILVNEFNFKE